MKSTFIVSIALLALASLPTSASPGAYEDGEELLPSMVTLPSLADGTVGVQICAACNRYTYVLNAETSFYVADQKVSYSEFKTYVAAHPQAVVHLVTPVKQNIVKRLEAK